MRMMKMMCLLAALLALLGSAVAETGETMDIYSMDENITSLEVAQLMGNGINLGNTYEAYGRRTLGLHARPDAYATCWGQPVTTREMIAGMKAAGFDTLRIPVAWTNTMDFENDNFRIAESYLARVEEVTRWALEEDMYVIVNDHWDGGWLGMFGSGDAKLEERAMNVFTGIWTQVGERFAKYGDHLIFEAANEEFGDRFNDLDYAPNGGKLNKDACFRKLAELNQVFVDLIRAQGGNNASRFLLIPGYNTDIINTCDSRYHMPKDEWNRLLLSVHFYDPAGYTMQGSLNSWGTEKDYAQMNSLLEKMTKYTAQGYGIVIGEYGVIAAKNGQLRGDALKYTRNFLNNCDLYGYCPVLWDCNFMYNRRACRMLTDELEAFYTARSAAAQSGMTEEEIRQVAKAEMEADAAAATTAKGVKDGEAVAWLMFNSGDWCAMYSVGDTYDPTQITDGITATDAVITAPGEYTVGLDFTDYGKGYVTGTAFCALGIANGEKLYPRCCIDIKRIEINGEEYAYAGQPYTTSDDGKCTRVNLYNMWVPSNPSGGRTPSGTLTDASPMLLNNNDRQLERIKTLYITFELIVP